MLKLEKGNFRKLINKNKGVMIWSKTMAAGCPVPQDTAAEVWLTPSSPSIAGLLCAEPSILSDCRLH